MKNNICVIGLANKYTKYIAGKLAKKLDMYFADVDALIDFDVISRKETVELCGKEYLEKIERKKVKQAVSFENTLITLNHSLLNYTYNCEKIVDSCLVIYLRILKNTYEKKLNNEKVRKLGRILAMSVMEDRNKICENIADVVVDCDDKTLTSVINDINTGILNYYKK